MTISPFLNVRLEGVPGIRSHDLHAPRQTCMYRKGPLELTSTSGTMISRSPSGFTYYFVTVQPGILGPAGLVRYFALATISSISSAVMMPSSTHWS